MDFDSDEGIERLRDIEDQAFDEPDASINPIRLLQRGPSTDDSERIASFNALHTAFDSLQKKLRDKDKQLAECKKKTKEMSKQLQETNVDDFFDVHPAGATGCEEMAESNAKEGYIKQLQRELYMSKLQNEENKKKYLQENDGLRTSNDVLSRSLQDMENSCAIKDNEIQNLTESLQKERNEKDTLLRQLREAKEKIHTLERNEQGVASSRDGEVQELKSKVYNLENDRKRFFAEIDKLTKERDEFMAKYKQLSIQAEIAQKNHSNLKEDNESLRRMEETDDVDGDINRLQMALHMVQSQKQEYEELKQKFLQQTEIIKQLTSQYRGKLVVIGLYKIHF